MPQYTNLLLVVLAAFAAPLVLGLAPALRLPAVVLEIVAGIVIGPSGLGWVEVDGAVTVLSTLGLAFLLFLAGLEIELDGLRGRTLRVAGLGFAVSVGLALVASLGLSAVGAAGHPLFIAVVLTSTSLGVVVPLLSDARAASTPFGQLVIASASIADFGAIILLSLFFSREATGTDTKLALLGAFAAAIVAVALAARRVERSMRLTSLLVRLQDTTAQIRIRGAFVLLVAFGALAQHLGLETILGAFAAGALLNGIDRDRAMTHPDFRKKLAAVGYGVFVPVFFVTSGLRFDLGALFASASTLARVPLFVLAIVLVRALPALLYRGIVDRRQIVIAGLLQSTTLPFVVAATMIGRDLDVISPANAAAFVAAGLVSVLVFPLAAATMLASERPEPLARRAAAIA